MRAEAVAVTCAPLLSRVGVSTSTWLQARRERRERSLYSTLLKLAELKALDKKSTLLHFVVKVVHESAPTIVKVIESQKVVRDAARVSLDDLRAKKLEAERGLDLVDKEITWHDERRLREQDAADEDQFADVFTEFFNWASERKEHFDEVRTPAEPAEPGGAAHCQAPTPTTRAPARNRPHNRPRPSPLPTSLVCVSGAGEGLCPLHRGLPAAR
jgi:hypothetical protein